MPTLRPGLAGGSASKTTTELKDMVMCKPLCKTPKPPLISIGLLQWHVCPLKYNAIII